MVGSVWTDYTGSDVDSTSYLYPFPIQVKPGYHHPFCKLLPLLNDNKASNFVSLFCRSTRSCAGYQWIYLCTTLLRARRNSLPSVGLLTATKLWQKQEHVCYITVPNSYLMNRSMICGRTERIPVYCILVKPTVAWWVHLVELGQHGPDGFVGEVVHQLLQAKKINSSRKFYSVFLHQEKPNIYFSLGTGDFILVIRLNPSRIKTCLCSIKTKSKTCLPAGRHQRYHRTAPRGCRRCRGRPLAECKSLG